MLDGVPQEPEKHRTAEPAGRALSADRASDRTSSPPELGRADRPVRSDRFREFRALGRDPCVRSDRGLQFHIFAFLRIRGAMLDSLRITIGPKGWSASGPGGCKTRSSGWKATWAGRPTEAETAAALGVSIEELAALSRETCITSMISLERRLTNQPFDAETKSKHLGDVLSDPRSESPARAETRRDLMRLVCRGCSESRAAPHSALLL